MPCAGSGPWSLDHLPAVQPHTAPSGSRPSVGLGNQKPLPVLGSGLRSHGLARSLGALPRGRSPPRGRKCVSVTLSLPAVAEPSGPQRDPGRRPAGLSQVPPNLWTSGARPKWG